ncbi:hypothetical protein WA158_000969 [Blastocystis sp. Blastoise]
MFKYFVYFALFLCVFAKRRVYIAMKDMDVSGHDIKSTGVTNVDILKKLCEDTEGCVAFNENGYLKNSTEWTYSSNSVVWLAEEATSFAQEPDMPIWPMPLTYEHGSVNVIVDPQVQFSSNVENEDLSKAFERYSSLMFDNHAATDYEYERIKEIHVSVENPEAKLQFEVDESYSLSIPTEGTINIHAPTIFGAYYALESLSQLVHFNRSQEFYIIQNCPWNITDAPQFPHRGLLVDSVRHFLPVRDIKRIIDSIAHVKFNVMHWHITDNEAFVIKTNTYPKLWDTAYTDEERYTQTDIKSIVEYARLRGVRIMPEIDVPGHMKSWCNVYPEVCPSETCYEPIDPSNDNAFNLIDSVIGEFCGEKSFEGLFPGEFFHLGGDEVDTKCWSQTERIATWMKNNGMSTTDTYKYTVDKAHEMVMKRDRTPVNWEEVVTHISQPVDKNAIIQIWLGGTATLPIIKKGYRVLISKKWYLDDLNNQWDVFYNNDPYNGVTDPEDKKMVLGGEACMWAETVDPSDWFNTVWPRAAAVAERLWTAPEKLDVNKAQNRIMHFRGLLNERGFGAAPTLNKVGRSAPSRQSSFYWQ